MDGRYKLAGWEIYPENLSYVQSCDLHGYNFTSYGKQLKADSPRIFLPSYEKISVKVIEFGGQDTVFQNVSTLEEYLESLPDEPVTRLILIPQQTSWGHLVIDENSLRKILTRFSVFPPFVDVIRTFGQKIGFEDESCGGFQFRNDRKAEVFETAYVVKQVEEHGREEGDPWSIRQMGIYHRSDASSGDVFIVINPSVALKKRLTHLQDFGSRPSPKALHTIVLYCAMENWKFYIISLEKRYLEMKNKAQLTRMDETGEKERSIADVRFEDIQEIQVVQDKCQQLCHVFNMNQTILHDMETRFATIPSVSGIQDVAELEFVQSLILETDIQMNQVNSMLKRLDGTIALIRTTLDFRCLASLQHNSRLMTEMTRLTALENGMIVQLTKKSSRDTDIMKIITFLGLVYLPASFVASMMGMGYISVDNAENFSIHVKGEFGVFAILTVVLLLCTLLPYLLYIRRYRAGEEEV